MMETQTKIAANKSDDGGWTEYVWYAVILYGIAGFFFYLSHREEAPTALAWALFALSPALLIAGGALSVFFMGAGLVGMVAVFQSKWWCRLGLATGLVRHCPADHCPSFELGHGG